MIYKYTKLHIMAMHSTREVTQKWANTDFSIGKLNLLNK
jgi:hypothetical protein